MEIVTALLNLWTGWLEPEDLPVSESTSPNVGMSILQQDNQALLHSSTNR